jgi:hypothetical protein
MALLLRRLHPLVGRGYTVVGPTMRDGAIVLAELACADELSYGWEETPGRGRPLSRPKPGPSAIDLFRYTSMQV